MFPFLIWTDQSYQSKTDPFFLSMFVVWFFFLFSLPIPVIPLLPFQFPRSPRSLHSTIKDLACSDCEDHPLLNLVFLASATHPRGLPRSPTGSSTHPCFRLQELSLQQLRCRWIKMATRGLEAGVSVVFSLLEPAAIFTLSRGATALSGTVGFFPLTNRPR